MSAILAYSEPGSAAQALAGAGGQLAADGTADRRWQRLSDVLMLTGDPDSPAGVLPSLGLLPHELRVAPADVTALAVGQAADIVLIDARRDLMHAKGLFLAQHPARVFTRSQLLQEGWSYDYFGGPRTVHVHVRRLRAKLGAEYALMT